MTERLAVRHWATLVALAAIFIITLVWWALALWPLPAEAPPWIARARAVCFGTTASGLPNGTGWMTLIGQPTMMTLLLVSISGGVTMGEAIRGLARYRAGRVVLALWVFVGTAGIAAAGVRVAYGCGLIGAPPEALVERTIIPPEYPRLDRPAPALGLVDQQGRPVTLEGLHGRPAIVAFAYAHCQTICPTLVQQVVQARARLAAQNPAVVVVTLDPWRDTPDRLPALAEQWHLPEGVQIVSGDVPSVEAVLDRWNVPRTRDEKTGEVTHPNLIYIVDANGKIAYATKGDADAIEQLVKRL